MPTKKIVATLLKYCLRPQLSGDEWQTFLIAAPNVPAPHQSDAPGTLLAEDVVGKETFDNPSTAAAPDPVRDPVCACARPRDQVRPTEIRTSISPSSAVELNTTSALASYATEAGLNTYSLDN
uniref:Uncharacterized protein n=1 Tax=Timema douglasi TaxID=61478 RepID=A0A7R8ZAF6_TIMDO|nr:unnamed protein product [Timema douglasi]